MNTGEAERDLATLANDQHDDDAPPMRRARLGLRTLELYGRVLVPGDRLVARFSIAPARGAIGQLTAARLRDGLILMTTLPNIHKHACSAQLVQTQRSVQRFLPAAAVVHVASDGPEYWAEVDRLHGSITATGYSLQGSADAEAFRLAFGVGVRGTERIARGLFAFCRGVVLGAEVPEDQSRTPDVKRFVARVHALAALNARTA